MSTILALFLVLNYAKLVPTLGSVFVSILEHLASDLPLVCSLIIFRFHFKYHLIKEVFPEHAFQGSYSLLFLKNYKKMKKYVIYPVFITIWNEIPFLKNNFIIFVPAMLKTVYSMRKACLLEYLHA